MNNLELMLLTFKRDDSQGQHRTGTKLCHLQVSEKEQLCTSKRVIWYIRRSVIKIL